MARYLDRDGRGIWSLEHGEVGNFGHDYDDVSSCVNLKMEFFVEKLRLFWTP